MPSAPPRRGDCSQGALAHVQWVQGSMRARRSSTPALPYIARFSILQPIDLTFSRTVVPASGNGLLYRVVVLLKAADELLHAIDPGPERLVDPITRYRYRHWPRTLIYVSSTYPSVQLLLTTGSQ